MANVNKEEKTILDKAYVLVDKLTTKEQKDLKEFLEKILQAKADAARNELELIGGKE